MLKWATSVAPLCATFPLLQKLSHYHLALPRTGIGKLHPSKKYRVHARPWVFLPFGLTLNSLLFLGVGWRGGGEDDKQRHDLPRVGCKPNDTLLQTVKRNGPLAGYGERTFLCVCPKEPWQFLLCSGQAKQTSVTYKRTRGPACFCSRCMLCASALFAAFPGGWGAFFPGARLTPT